MPSDSGGGGTSSTSSVHLRLLDARGRPRLGAVVEGKRGQRAREHDQRDQPLHHSPAPRRCSARPPAASRAATWPGAPGGAALRSRRRCGSPRSRPRAAAAKCSSSAARGSASTSDSIEVEAFRVKRCGGTRADQPKAWPGVLSSIRTSCAVPRTCIGRERATRPAPARRGSPRHHPARRARSPGASRAGDPSATISAASSSARPTRRFRCDLRHDHSQFTSGDAVRVCSDSPVGRSWKDSAAACSRRM